MKGGFELKILNSKITVISILVFLSFIVIALSLYIVYMVNNETECFCEPTESLMISDESPEELPETINVEIKGAVNTPGVYEMNEDNIINDAIALAGGFTADAYTDNINLSKKVTDELVVYVFTKKEYDKNNKTSSSTPNNNTNNSYTIDEQTKNNVSIITSSENNNTDEAKEQGLININIANASELATLPGIGETKANSIIAYRTENGFFKTIEDLKNVSGIGDTTFEKLKAYITV